VKKSIRARTVVYPTPVFVVATYDREGRPNAMTAAWGGICASQPPCVAVSIRESRYTTGNIIQRGAFTINIPSEEHVQAADYFGMVSGRNADKFAATGLTAVASDLVDAPYIAEFPLALECRVIQRIEIGSHIQFVGQIVGIQAEESVLTDGEALDIEKVKPALYAPENGAYYGVGERLGKAFCIGEEFVEQDR
jgi:flavin reductase (DIM6/NTAB) family NADH-FMN oxidoreductase RutF